jgi:MFS family permease
LRSGSRYRDLLQRNPDFRRLYLARLISFGGDWFLLVPMIGLVNELSGSPLLTAAVLTANTLPAFLFSPIGGVMADRLARRRIMIWSNLAAVATTALLLTIDSRFVTVRGAGVGVALTGLAILAAMSALIAPASSAALPEVVDPGDLADATFLIESTWGTMAAVGAAAGGLVATVFGRGAAILIDAVSFAVAAILIARVSRVLNPPASSGHQSSGTLREAFVYVGHNPPVAALLTSKAGFALFAGGTVALLPVLALDVFGAGDAGTGLLLGARGVGVLIGPFLLRRFRGGSDRMLLGTIGPAMALWGVSYLGTAAAPTLALACLGVLIGHMGGGSQWTFSSYGLQRYTSEGVRGRVFGLDFAAVTLTSTFSQLLFGWLAENTSIRQIITWLAISSIGFGLAWWRATSRFWAIPPQPAVMS